MGHDEAAVIFSLDHVEWELHPGAANVDLKRIICVDGVGPNFKYWGVWEDPVRDAVVGKE